jgi:hypothetical protein
MTYISQSQQQNQRKPNKIPVNWAFQLSHLLSFPPQIKTSLKALNSFCSKSKSLTINQRAVLKEIADDCLSYQVVFTAQQTYANRTGLSLKTINTIIGQLKGMNFISAVYRYFETSLYSVSRLFNYEHVQSSLIGFMPYLKSFFTIRNLIYVLEENDINLRETGHRSMSFSGNYIETYLGIGWQAPPESRNIPKKIEELPF